MRVTKLRTDKRAPHLVVVEVDGARFATIPPEVVEALGIRSGMELDADGLAGLENAADVEAAHRVALRLLAMRPRSSHELLYRLRHRGHNPSAVAAVVGRLETNGLVDDREFARHFARVRGARGHGRARLLTDLLAKGVERRVAERAIDEVLEAEGLDPLAQARGLATRRLAQLGRLPPERLARRVLGYLGRRGFRGYEIREMVRELVREGGSGTREA